MMRLHNFNHNYRESFTCEQLIPKASIFLL